MNVNVNVNVGMGGTPRKRSARVFHEAIPVQLFSGIAISLDKILETWR